MDDNSERTKVGWRVSEELAALVRQVAAAERVSPASAVDALLYDALTRYADGALELDRHLVATPQGRYPWTVEIPRNGLGAAIAQRLTIT